MTVPVDASIKRALGADQWTGADASEAASGLEASGMEASGDGLSDSVGSFVFARTEKIVMPLVKGRAEKRQAYENGKNGMHKNTSGMFYYILIEKRKKYADKAWFILLTQKR